jgi:hypothetical protein
MRFFFAVKNADNSINNIDFYLETKSLTPKSRPYSKTLAL